MFVIFSCTHNLQHLMESNFRMGSQGTSSHNEQGTIPWHNYTSDQLKRFDFSPYLFLDEWKVYLQYSAGHLLTLAWSHAKNAQLFPECYWHLSDTVIWYDILAVWLDFIISIEELIIYPCCNCLSVKDGIQRAQCATERFRFVPAPSKIVPKKLHWCDIDPKK